MTIDDDTQALRREIDRRRLRAVVAGAQEGSTAMGMPRQPRRVVLSTLFRLRRAAVLAPGG